MNDYLILHSFSNNREVVEEQNYAVAVVEAATLIGTGYIMRCALAGWEGGFWVSVGWFIIGQIFFILIARVYCLMAKSIFEELDNHNLAAAFSFSGFILGGAIIMGHGVHGEFTSWTQDIIVVAVYLPMWLGVMAAVSWAADLVIYPGVRLRDEVVINRNIGAGYVEGVLFVSFSMLFSVVL